MKLLLAVSVHNFQRRFCWMMNSFDQMIMPEGMEFNTSVAYIEGNGDPSTEDVIKYFDIEHSLPHKDHEEFQYRGLMRNKQAKYAWENGYDWVAFMDCDMIFPPNWAIELHHKLIHVMHDVDKTTKDKCLFAGRFSTVLEPTEDLIRLENYLEPIPDVWHRVEKLPNKRKANIGAGYLHIARAEMLKERGYYVNPKKCRDWNWEKKHSKCRSDMQFRRSVGGHKIALPRLIHLQHIRDSDLGVHVEIQR